LLSTTCNLIKTSSQLTDTQKLDKWYAVFPLIQSLIEQTHGSSIPKASDLGVVADFNTSKEQSICGMFKRPNCDDAHEYYVTLLELKNKSNTTMANVSTYVEVIPFTGYVQLHDLTAAPGNEIEDFKRETVDQNGFVIANRGTYKIHQLLSDETNTVKIYTIWPLRRVGLGISTDAFHNTWVAECNDERSCAEGKEVVAMVVD
jgi:hypothetical protein